MSRDELVDLIKKISEGQYSTEEEGDALIETLERNVSDPYAVGYIFGKEYEDLSPVEIADKILSYKPMIL